MSILIKCPNGHKLRLKDRAAGKKVRCPECGTILRVPGRSKHRSRSDDAIPSEKRESSLPRLHRRHSENSRTQVQFDWKSLSLIGGIGAFLAVMAIVGFSMLGNSLQEDQKQASKTVEPASKSSIAVAEIKTKVTKPKPRKRSNKSKNELSTPKDAFANFQTAVSKNDWKSAAAYTTEKSQKEMIGGLTIVVSLITAFDESKKPELEKMFLKHGLDMEKMQPDVTSSSEKNPFEKLTEVIKDKPVYIADLMQLLLSFDKKFEDSENCFNILAAVKLGAIQINGDKATATLTSSENDISGPESIDFIKTNGQWLIQFSDEILAFDVPMQGDESNKGSVSSTEEFEVPGKNDFTTSNDDPDIEPEKVSDTQPSPAPLIDKDELQTKISLSYEKPFSLFVPKNVDPLFITLELSGKEVNKFTAYGFLKIKPVRDDKGKLLKPIKSEFSHQDPTRKFVRLDVFSKNEGSIKIDFMYEPPSEKATHLSAFEGSFQLKAGDQDKPVTVPFKIENIALSGEGGKIKFQTPSNHGGFFSFAFSPDEKFVAGGTGTIRDGNTGKLYGGGEVILWNSGTGKTIKTLGSLGKTVRWVAYSLDGKTLASASNEDDGSIVKLWNMPSGKKERSWKAPVENGKWKRLILSPDGRTIYAVIRNKVKDGESSSLQFAAWNTDNGKLNWILPVSNSSAMALSPDGTIVACHMVKSINHKVVSNELQLFDGKSGETIKAIELDRESPRDGIAFLPDGKTILGITYRKIQLWDIESGKIIKTLDLGSDSSFKTIAVSNDGKTVALPLFMGKKIEFWDLESGKPKGKIDFKFPNNFHNPEFTSDLSRMVCSLGHTGPAVLEITELEPFTPPQETKKIYRKKKTAKNKQTKQTHNGKKKSGKSTSQSVAKVNKHKSSPMIDLTKTAKFAASSQQGEKFNAEMAFDGNSTTHWHSKQGDIEGAWLAAWWEHPVTIQKLVIRQSHDRITNFVIQRFDSTENDWVDLMYIFSNRHLSSYSRKGEKKGWGYRHDAVWVDGKRLGDSKDRVFGSHPHGSTHPIFTINLPDALTASGIRIYVRKATGDMIGIYEMEISGTRNSFTQHLPKKVSGSHPPLEKAHRKKKFVTSMDKSKNPDGFLLYQAVAQGDVVTANAMLKKLPNVVNKKSPNNRRDTLLHIASARGRIGIVKLLLSKGADINVTNADSNTPLHRAAYYNKKDIVALLIKNGADRTIKNKNGKTPLRIATDQGYDEVRNLLDVKHSSNHSNNSHNNHPKGFKSLFDGKSLDGWKGQVGNLKARAKMSKRNIHHEQVKADHSMHSHWKANNGLLVFDGKGKNLCTEKEYGDFELLIDWKIHKSGDSGILLRGMPQVQIWDTEDKKLHKLGAIKGSGGLYNNKHHERFPLVKADKPVGQWNTFHIRMEGNRVTVYLNEKLIVDKVVMENRWFPGQPLPQKGPIELQSYGKKLYFRNIHIKELDGFNNNP
jgi:3-keto-disaccharide hydrolase/Ankyrin repeats (3 copies)